LWISLLREVIFVRIAVAAPRLLGMCVVLLHCPNPWRRHEITPEALHRVQFLHVQIFAHITMAYCAKDEKLYVKKARGID
jgi:hypothetical protein